MSNSSLTSVSLYVLQAISFLGERKYSVRLVKNSESIEATCEVKRVNGQKIGSFDLVEFQSDKFNDLCTHGHIYPKSLSKAILAFHECIYSAVVGES